MANISSFFLVCLRILEFIFRALHMADGDLIKHDWMKPIWNGMCYTIVMTMDYGIR